MKKTRKWGVLLLAAGLTAFTLYGCQSGNTKEAAPETTEISEETPETVSGDETLPDTEDVEQTDLDQIGGEGTTDNVLPDLTAVSKAPLEEPCVMEGVSGEEFCTLTINSITTTDDRNEGDPEEPEKVVVLDYTYENTESEEPLLLDDLSFKLLDGDTVCQPYYLSTLTPAEPAESGETASGQIAFSVSKDCKQVILYFENGTSGAAAAFETKL